ncbi:receptor-like protein EIX2 isoform X2 [Cucumis sativus]|uniref:receptor-like protein EIX2 isoform X2 n=1 Tax=Cucumis sativus TaxID=3659 RepID=UPI0012F4D58F|nr:receptor-like protein EIX2 isoform X2 [Cucumis sativus]KAE8650537.1 hypothetical protein Csa_011217 [Cucumis sativus]
MISLTEIWCFTSIHLFVFLLLFMPPNLALEIKCRESERQALLSFKQSLVYRYDILSSWTTQAKANDDCCNWIGVGCSNNITGGDYHITRLDLHNTGLMGTIPTCIYKFDALTKTLNASEVPDYLKDLVMMWKGKETLIHGRNLQLQRSIDLSCNRLTGEIPNKITELVGLVVLNLSRNELTGQIPYNIGQLQSLDFLDPSRNNLCGTIPFSFSQMPRLSVLDLSCNNLSGNIPIGTQLQSFPVSSYEGNPYLCGDPLKKKCKLSNNNNSIAVENGTENEGENQDRLIVQDLLFAISSGFIIGFWGIFGSLLLFKRWRLAYFKFLRNIIEKPL